MQIDAHEIDDFKTERKDVMPPLPMVFRLVPILFYCSLGFLVVVGSLAILHGRMASAKRDAFIKNIADVKSDIAKRKAERAELEAKIREATDLESWVLASMPLQPLVVNLIRSMGPKSSIVSLTIERDAETPSQLRMNLRLNTDSDQQLEDSLEVIRGMHYREFSPTQTRVRGDLDYKASLLWQNPHVRPQTPQDRAGEIKPL